MKKMFMFLVRWAHLIGAFMAVVFSMFAGMSLALGQDLMAVSCGVLTLFFMYWTIMFSKAAGVADILNHVTIMVEDDGDDDTGRIDA